MKNGASTIHTLRKRASQRIYDIQNMSSKVQPTIGMLKDCYCLLKEMCVRMEKLEQKIDSVKGIPNV